MSAQLILKSRRVATAQGLRPAAVLIEGGKIAAVLAHDSAVARHAEDLGAAVILPGLVDTHVHINEPGRTEWEGFDTATRAAAAGGITTVVDMPLNSIPVTTSLAALEAKRRAAEGRVWTDIAFWGGVVPGNAAELAPMMAAGAAGFKAFLVHSGIDDFPNVGEAELRSAMPALAKLRSPLLVHAELAPKGAPEPAPAAGRAWRYPEYLASRPKSWENDAVRLMVSLCRELKTPVHIVHLSSAEALEPLRSAKREGLPLTAETCPHYLYFAAEQIPADCTEFKCSPPIREAGNREKLWEALEDGTLDFIVSDHSPCAPELKRREEGDFAKAWGGISSVQFGLSVVWTAAAKRGWTLSALAEKMCSSPAVFAGLGRSKGRIAPGFDADLAVFDPEAEFTVEPALVRHRHKLTPYLGQRLRGAVRRSYLRGEKIYDEGAFAAAPSGRLLRRTYDA